MLEYKHKARTKKSKIKILRFLSEELPNLKAFKILMATTLLIHLGSSIITMFYIIFGYLTHKEALGYLPCVLITIWPISTICVMFHRPNVTGNLKNEFYMWDIKAADAKTCRKINQKALILNLHTLFNLMFCFVGGVLFFFELPEDKEIFFIYKFINDVLPNQKRILIFIYRAYLPITGYAMTLIGFQTIFYTQNICFQFDMLKNYIANISTTEKLNIEEELFYNKTYQKEVKQRLVFCIKRFNEFSDVINNKLKEINHLIVILAVTGCSLGIGIVLLLLFGNLSFDFYIRVSFLSVGTVSLYAGLMWSGQKIEDSFQNMEKACFVVNWYNFHKDNKRIYLIFAVNLMKLRKLRFSENYSLNYALGLGIVRAIYTVISVIINYK